VTATQPLTGTAGALARHCAAELTVHSIQLIVTKALFALRAHLRATAPAFPVIKLILMHESRTSLLELGLSVKLKFVVIGESVLTPTRLDRALVPADHRPV